ncbi:MAG TPA: 2-oxoacid:acceptor oxidoreductase family protein [Thermodesulfobacteriota bacterium]
MADDETRALPPRRPWERPAPAAARAADPQWDLVVGGLASQHVPLLAEVVAAAARLEGYTVQYWLDLSEARLHGGVRAHVRVGPAASPKVPRGCASLLVGLETGEARRLARYLAPGGAAIVPVHAWPTLDAKLGRSRYPDAERLAQELSALAKRVVTLDLARLGAEGAAPEPPPPGAEALVALGAITALTHVVDRESVVRAVRDRMGKAADVAVEACLAGYRAVAGDE